jgi:hypothetical protein
MVGTGKPGLLITQQLRAAEKAVPKAKSRYL